MTTAVAVTMLLLGCAHNSTTEPQFGDSVRHMTEQQIYNLDAAYNPDPNPVEGGDVDRLTNVLESHRGDVADPAEASGALEVGVRSDNR
ncbi:MAG: hypothetical protein WD795_12640 [Woeseia sp.]